MARLALSFALVSIASTFVLGGCGSTPQTDADESTSAAEKGCVYDSTGHVIDCVTPPDTTTSAAIENAASDGTTTGSASSSSSSSGSSKGPTTGGLGSSSSASSGGPSTGAGSSSASSSGAGSAPTGASAVCAGLANELATELAAAQACTVGEPSTTAVGVCDAWVPTVNGCEQPVAEAGSAATQKYLETYDVYAAHCPIEVLPCVAPQDQKTICWPTTAAATAGLPGRCEIAGGAAPGGPSPAE